VKINAYNLVALHKIVQTPFQEGSNEGDLLIFWGSFGPQKGGYLAKTDRDFLRKFLVDMIIL